jgi:hypothetical protein
MKRIRLSKIDFEGSGRSKNKMSNFPLYDSLLTGLPDKDLTVAQKNNFLKRVAKIDQGGIVLVYALIRVYQRENSDDDLVMTSPYKCKLVNDTAEFDLERFPTELKQLLYKFITMHLKRMKDE